MKKKIKMTIEVVVLNSNLQSLHYKEVMLKTDLDYPIFTLHLDPSYLFPSSEECTLCPDQTEAGHKPGLRESEESVQGEL